MFCMNCGKSLPEASAFCPSCGSRVYRGAEGRAYYTSDAGLNAGRPMLRPRSPRVIAGVCAAFAQHFGWDVGLVRGITAILACFYGVGLFAYMAGWILIPEAPFALPTQSR